MVQIPSLCLEDVTAGHMGPGHSQPISSTAAVRPDGGLRMVRSRRPSDDQVHGVRGFSPHLASFGTLLDPLVPFRKSR